jgi:hypothetical protein
MKVFNNQPMPVLTLGDRVQSLEINRNITVDRVSECMLMCDTNSSLITQIQVILSALSNVPLEYELGNILLWNTTLDTPSNAIILTSSPQELSTTDYYDLYNKLNTDDIQFGDTFQIPYMTDESTPSPYSVSASSQSDTAWHALNSGTTNSEDDSWQADTRNNTTFTVEFGNNYYKIVELALRPRATTAVPSNFRVEGINSDDSFTVLKQYTSQNGYSTSSDKIFTLPATNDVYKGIRFYNNAGFGGNIGFIRFIVKLQAPLTAETFFIPAQPSSPQDGKEWIMIVSNS